MLGRSAADAAFDFALAGAEGGVIDALASLQAEEFCSSAESNTLNPNPNTKPQPQP